MQSCTWYVYDLVYFCTSYLWTWKSKITGISLYHYKVDATDDDAKAVLKYLDSPSCLERPLNKLEHVSINIYESAKAELCFVKQLLSRTPSLLRMRISQKTDIDVDIALELMRFPRASPRAELSYFPYQD